MAKLIFTSRYLRDVPAPRIEHYVRYIGTREGVEKMAGGRDNLPATKNQKQYIEEMVRKIPEARYHIDRKRRKKLTERRRAQGHRTDDHEPEQQIEG